jgi:hypothetical protein
MKVPHTAFCSCSWKRLTLHQPELEGVINHAQDPPPESGRVELEVADHISNLPGGVLGDIISLLLMEGART